MFGRLADSINSMRRWWMLGAILVVIGLGCGAVNLQGNFSLESFFGSEDTAWSDLERYKTFWGPDDDKMLIASWVEKGDFLTRDRLLALEAMTRELEALDIIKEVTSLPTIIRMQSGESDSLVLASVMDTFPIDSDNETLQSWRDEILSDVLLVPALVARDAKSTALLVQFTESSSKMDKVAPMVANVREVTNRYADKLGMKFAEAGIPAVRADFFGQMLKDQAVFLPAAMILMALCLFVVFKSAHGVLIPGIAATVPLVMLFGLMGYRGGHIDMVNQTLATVLPAIAVADAIHLLSRFHEEARKIAAPGELLSITQRRQAIRAALKELGGACFLTSLTTGVGFGSLAIAKMPILRSMGVNAAIGIVFSYASVLIVMPLLLSMTKGVVPKGPKAQKPIWMDRWLDSSAALALRHPGLMLAGGAIVAAIFAWYSQYVVVDNNLTRMLPPEHRTSQANALVDKKLGGILNYEFDMVGKPGDLKRPEVLKAMQAFETYAKTLPSIREMSSPATYVANAHAMMGGPRTVPDSPAAVAQLLLLLEDHDEMLKMLDTHYDRGRMVLRGQDHGANYFAGIEQKLREAMPKYFDGLGVDVYLTGTGVVAYRGINNVTFDLRDSLIFAFALVALVIAFVFRKLSITLIALVPNGLPLLIGYGTMGMMGIDLDPTAGLIFTVGLGIAVDDTIHLLARFREEINSGKPRDEAIMETVRQSGRAICITSIILTFGIGVNMLSGFTAIAAMGTAGAVIISSALLCDVYLMPALLKLMTPQNV